MSNGARILGLIVAATMGAFSTYIFLQTGDWVAAVFIVGSMAYGILFSSNKIVKD